MIPLYLLLRSTAQGMTIQTQAKQMVIPALPPMATPTTNFQSEFSKSTRNKLWYFKYRLMLQWLVM